jgi:hypothetical protein
MNVKTIFFFDSGPAGWQEVYYQQPSDLNTAFTNALTLARFRAALMGDPTTLRYIRVNDDNNPRNSTLTEVDITATITYQSKADKPSSAQMMRLYASGQTRTRPLFLRGNPDDVYDVADPTNGDAQLWKGYFGAFGDQLKAGLWFVKYRPRPIFVTQGPNTKNVLDITVWLPVNINASLTLVTTAQPVTGITPNSFVQIYKLVGLPFPPGLCRVASVVGADTINIVYPTRADFVYTQGGALLPYVPNYTAINDYAITARSTRRATGRPFDQSRGRRKSIRR